MIRHTYLRAPGGRRYSSTERAAARHAVATGAPGTVTAEALAAMLDQDGIRVVADVLFELESNRLGRPVTTRLLVDDTETAPTSGDPAVLTNGRRVDTPVVLGGVTADTLDTLDTVVELTWSNLRRVNVVEVHGHPGLGQVTAAAVDVATAPGVWEPAASDSSPAGRLAIRLPETAWAYGVRVHVDAVDAGPGDPVGIVEVDPMFVRDVSQDVTRVDVAWTRETDPGSTSDPVGNYQASEITVELDDTDGDWNPATNASLDVGHRIEVAFGVCYEAGGLELEELFPAGVFYSEPFDTDSTSETVTIAGTDRLGRNNDVAVSEPVLVDATIAEAVTQLAANYLDLDVDQVDVAPSIAPLVFPYLYPSGNLGSYLADLAKATAATIHVDALDRLVMARRADVADDPVAEITERNALLAFRRPPGYDVTTSIVTVNASPLEVGEVGDLWAMPSGGITVPIGGSHVLIAKYDNPPGIGASVSGVVTDGDYTITAEEFYADRAEVTIRNDEPAVPLVVADLRIVGTPLVEGTLTARAEHAPSVMRYGPREIEVDARLAQTQTQVELIASVLLDAFRSIDDDGVRRLPDLTFDALGVLHLTAGDRVTLAYPAKGLGGDYTILGRRLVYAEGGILSNDVQVRESPSELVYMIADRGLLTDDGVLAGY